MNEDERVELLALTWLGRGDSTAENWPRALNRAGLRRFDRREPEYLAGTPLLGNYIEEALTPLGYLMEDLAGEEGARPRGQSLT